MKRLVLQPYGPEWRELRRVMHVLLTGRAADSSKTLEDLESRQAMYDMLREPETWYLHTIRFAASCKTQPRRQRDYYESDTC